MKYQLPKEFATKWVAALRSGEYKQIRGSFHGEDNCYCVLGLGYAINGMEFDILGLPKWNIPDKIANGLYKKLLKMNDGEDLKFPEIADWIEANVEFI